MLNVNHLYPLFLSTRRGKTPKKTPRKPQNKDPVEVCVAYNLSFKILSPSFTITTPNCQVNRNSVQSSKLEESSNSQNLLFSGLLDHNGFFSRTESKWGKDFQTHFNFHTFKGTACLSTHFPTDLGISVNTNARSQQFNIIFKHFFIILSEVYVWYLFESWKTQDNQGSISQRVTTSPNFRTS